MRFIEIRTTEEWHRFKSDWAHKVYCFKIRFNYLKNKIKKKLDI